ncbi:virginiamycin B lyase family protein [Mycobacterium sp. 4D054]|uniref:virginiamycin B lyase family protein n=1 Tax=Mycobacterium sp. 4D054 TaxID=3457440 RepID=UPI003FD118FC
MPGPAGRPPPIAAGQRGCWFTEWAADRVGHLTADGVISKYALPVAASEPHGIAVVPDGTVWVAAGGRSVVGLR